MLALFALFSHLVDVAVTLIRQKDSQIVAQQTDLHSLRLQCTAIEQQVAEAAELAAKSKQELLALKKASKTFEDKNAQLRIQLEKAQKKDASLETFFRACRREAGEEIKHCETERGLHAGRKVTKGKEPLNKVTLNSVGDFVLGGCETLDSYVSSQSICAPFSLLIDNCILFNLPVVQDFITAKKIQQDKQKKKKVKLDMDMPAK